LLLGPITQKRQVTEANLESGGQSHNVLTSEAIRLCLHWLLPTYVHCLKNLTLRSASWLPMISIKYHSCQRIFQHPASQSSDTI